MQNENHQLLKKLSEIRVSTRQGRRSPHKPLLLLLAIGRQLNGETTTPTWEEIEPEIKRLIRHYGLPDSRDNGHLPFWRLQNDGIWQLDRPDQVRTTASRDPYISDLRQKEIRGSLLPEFKEAIDTDPGFLQMMLQILLNAYFPPSLHEDILIDTGLEGVESSVPIRRSSANPAIRDPQFRKSVLQAYNNQCAVCQMDLQVQQRPIGIEAAHIKWHSEGGPAQVTNGMALCLLHHKLFDAGIFTVSPNLTIHTSSSATGQSASSLIEIYQDSTLGIIPDSPELKPAPAFLDWHRKAVFKEKTTA